MTPNGDGDGDGQGPGGHDDQRLVSLPFPNTIVELWCVDDSGGPGGFYFALLIDGVGGPLHFAGKCAWPWGYNTHHGDVDASGALTGFTWYTRDADGPGYTGSQKQWEYHYDVASQTIVAKKVQVYLSTATPRTPTSTAPILTTTVSPAPTTPFSYTSIPGSHDPEECNVGAVYGEEAGGGVPTLTQLGVVLMAGLLLAIGTVRVGRRRQQ